MSKIFSIRRKTVFIGAYKGFLTEDNISDPFLGNFSDTRVYLIILGIRIKKLLHYRIDSSGKFYKGKV